MIARNIKKRLKKLANPQKAAVLRGFFKTGPGQYGEGDVFLGIMVPVLRKLSKEYDECPVREAIQLLKSSIHEERLLALFLLISAFSKGDDRMKRKIYLVYLRNTRYVNNWDLVDLSAPNIVGTYLLDKSRKPIYELARSRELWKKRIAILATFRFIRRNDFDDALRISKLLITDEHDLIQKAVGWMLREIGKREFKVEERFLKQYYKRMPRTMLRYAIERFPEAKRKKYLNGKI